MNRIFRLLLTANATLLLVIVFLVQKTYTINHLFPATSLLTRIPNWASYILYLIVPISLTGLSIILSSKLAYDEFKPGEITNIEYANNSFLPSYLGYFFVALSVQNWESLIIVYGMLFIFTYKSQALYFNPLFLLFGFEFYNAKTAKGTTIFLISRRRYRNPQEIEIKQSFRINDYTFIEKDA